MVPVWVTLLFALLQIAVLGALTLLSVRLVRRSGESLTAVFLSFTCALWFLSDLYWVIYDLMRPDTRMPFAANEIGEAAVLLMLAAVLSSVIPRLTRCAGWQGMAALLFGVCNTALWIVWSGEWIEDIMIGAAFTWLLYTIACGLKARNALARGEWIALSAGCALLILGEGATLLVKDNLKAAMDAACSLLLLAGVLFWAWKNARAARCAQETLCFAVASLCWALLAKYMSDGVWYLVFMTAETFALPAVWLAVRRAVSRP